MKHSSFLILLVFLPILFLLFVGVAFSQSGASCSSGLPFPSGYGCGSLLFSSWFDESTGGSNIDTCVITPAGNVECEGNAYRSYEVAQARLDFSWSQFSPSGACEPVALIVSNDYLLWEHVNINRVTFSLGAGLYSSIFYGLESVLYVESDYATHFSPYYGSFTSYVVLPAGVELESYSSFRFSTAGTSGIFGPRYIDYGFTIDAVGSPACVPVTSTPTVPSETFPDSDYGGECYYVVNEETGELSEELVSSSVLYNGSFETLEYSPFLNIHGWYNLFPEYPSKPLPFVPPYGLPPYHENAFARYSGDDQILCQFVTLPPSTDILLVSGYGSLSSASYPPVDMLVSVSGVVRSSSLLVDSGTWSALVDGLAPVAGNVSVCFSASSPSSGPIYANLDAVYAIPYSEGYHDGYFDLVCPDPALNPTPEITPSPTILPTSTRIPTLAPIHTLTPILTPPNVPLPPIGAGVTPQPTVCAGFETQHSEIISVTIEGVRLCLQPYQVSLDSEINDYLGTLTPFATSAMGLISLISGSSLILMVFNWVRKR